MMENPIIYTSEESMDYIVPCITQVENFLATIPTNVRWFFLKCIAYPKEDRYIFYYSSYATPEYKDFSISIECTQIDGRYIPKLLNHKEQND